MQLKFVLCIKVLNFFHFFNLCLLTFWKCEEQKSNKLVITEKRKTKWWFITGGNYEWVIRWGTLPQLLGNGGKTNYLGVAKSTRIKKETRCLPSIFFPKLENLNNCLFDLKRQRIINLQNNQRYARISLIELTFVWINWVQNRITLIINSDFL